MLDPSLPRSFRLVRAFSASGLRGALACALLAGALRGSSAQEFEVRSPVEPRIPWAGAPFDLVASDFDRDGAPDVVVVARWRSPTVLLAPGTPHSREVAVDARGSVQTGDFNVDGHEDLVVVGRDAVFLAGDGGGGFAEPVASGLDNDSPSTSTVETGDFNGDGAPDLFFFSGGPESPPPFGACGLDPSADDLSCESYAPCE